MKYSMNSLLSKLYDDALPKTDLLNCPIEEFHQCQENMLRRTEKVLKIKELREKLDKPIRFEKVEEFTSYNIAVDKYTVDAISELPFPVYILKPETPNHRVIFYLHGHDRFGVQGAIKNCEDHPYHKRLPIELAKEGYTVVAPEIAGFGEMMLENYPAGTDGVGDCYPISTELLVCGFNMAGLRVYQAMRTLDFIGELGISNVTVFGISGGGLVATFVGVLDQRITSIICSGYPNLYKTSTLSLFHCVDNYAPDMLSAGESSQVLSLAVPKPLLAINGNIDPIFPLEGTKKALDYIGRVYDRASAAGSFSGVIFEGEHEVSVGNVLKWLEGTKKS